MPPPSKSKAPPSSLVFSEVNYHPLDPTADEIAAGFTDADDFEFVELYNAGAQLRWI